jgi:hypothetical protein
MATFKTDISALVDVARQWIEMEQALQRLQSHATKNDAGGLLGVHAADLYEVMRLVPQMNAATVAAGLIRRAPAPANAEQPAAASMRPAA